MELPTFGGARGAGSTATSPSSRYILPSFEERTAYG